MDGFTLLAEPTRRRLLDLLAGGERSVTELVESLGLSQPLVSKHLRVLREAGAVEVSVDGSRRVYRLGPDPLREVLAWVEPYRRRPDRREAATRGTSQTRP